MEFSDKLIHLADKKFCSKDTGDRQNLWEAVSDKVSSIYSFCMSTWR